MSRRVTTCDHLFRHQPLFLCYFSSYIHCSRSFVDLVVPLISVPNFLQFQGISLNIKFFGKIVLVLNEGHNCVNEGSLYVQYLFDDTVCMEYFMHSRNQKNEVKISSWSWTYKKNQDGCFCTNTGQE